MSPHKYIEVDDPNYPEALKHISSPPQKLFYSGDVSLLNKTCISIVGTRNCSEYGENTTIQIIEELSKFDIVIVSGLAHGIDTIAHQEALKNDLPTIAVLGSDLNNIYPAKNIALSEEITQNGLLISEFENSPPRPQNFPMRNRIISGISIATIVVEAPDKSGSMITANFALDQGKEVFAVPADLDRESFYGNRLLIRDSRAQQLASISDLSLFLSGKMQSRQSSPSSGREISIKLTPSQEKLYQVLTNNRGTSFDMIHHKTKIPISRLLADISYLEVYGLIKVKNDRYFKTIP